LNDRAAPPNAGTPRFTIVLPTHNRADVLPFAIRGALWQTMGDFELLIAGDGCTDRTSEVVASFDDSRIRWFDLPKAPGIGYANRNVALREARGRYIAYLAHDDIWFPDHLERLGDALDRTGVEFAYSRGLGVGIDGRITPYWYNLGISQHQAGLWRGDCAITLCNVAHARSCLSRYGYWDETGQRGGDIVMWHGIVAGGRFRNQSFVSEPTALHFVASWRNTTSHRSLSWLSGWLVHDFIDQMLPDALRLPTTPERTQQETAWLRLAIDPPEKVREIREAVVQFSDALLWRSRTQPRLLGLRSGLMLGTVLERLWRGVLWVAAPERRRVFASLRNRTRALERTGR
jgi:glycosyltransferase involved in cell wall biosynthesis